MYDFIINIQPHVQKILFGQPWDTYIPPLLGTFLAIVVSVILARKNTKRTVDLYTGYIHAVKNATREHIKDTTYWRDLKRRQLLRMVIYDMKLNIDILGKISKSVNQKKYEATAEDFHLVIIEKCLTDTPIDDEQVNSDLIEVYHRLRVCQNHLSLIRFHEEDETSIKLVADIYFLFQTPLQNRQ